MAYCVPCSRRLKVKWGQTGLFLNSQRPSAFHAPGGSKASWGQTGLFLNSQRTPALHAPGGSQALFIVRWSSAVQLGPWWGFCSSVAPWLLVSFHPSVASATVLSRCLASGGQFGLFLNSQRPTGFHAQGGSHASGGQFGLFLNSQRPTEASPLVIIDNTVLFYRPGVRPWVGQKTPTLTPTRFLLGSSCCNSTTFTT